MECDCSVNEKSEIKQSTGAKFLQYLNFPLIQIVLKFVYLIYLVYIETVDIFTPYFSAIVLSFINRFEEDSWEPMQNAFQMSNIQFRAIFKKKYKIFWLYELIGYESCCF